MRYKYLLLATMMMFLSMTGLTAPKKHKKHKSGKVVSGREALAIIEQKKRIKQKANALKTQLNSAKNKVHVAKVNENAHGRIKPPPQFGMLSSSSTGGGFLWCNL